MSKSPGPDEPSKESVRNARASASHRKFVPPSPGGWKSSGRLSPARRRVSSRGAKSVFPPAGATRDAPRERVYCAKSVVRFKAMMSSPRSARTIPRRTGGFGGVGASEMVSDDALLLR